ncbi:MAG: hypothetical protein PHC50_00105 [Candidatus Cloacimonetes bacterium]|nr:hypothetical protein [Candidatus Cloacimonadota bacterium]
MRTDIKHVEKLENFIRQVIKPLSGLPFYLIIESISGFEVIQYDDTNDNHNDILIKLKEVAQHACKAINKKGIVRRRANEVGNDIEKYVITALQAQGIEAQIPVAQSGKRKASGYPDIEIIIDETQKHYIECKTYSHDTIDSSFRSFYLSPSADPKISHDAIHFIIGFETYAEKTVKKGNLYKVKAWKILDAYALECDVKHEFNSDNARLYIPTLILAEGDA